MKVACGFFYGNTKVWNLGAIAATEKTFQYYQIDFVAFSPNGNHIFSCVNDNVIIWNIKTGKQDNNLSYISRVRSMAFNSTGTQIVFGCAEGAIDDNRRGADNYVLKVLSLASSIDDPRRAFQQYTENTFFEHKSEIQSVAFSPNGLNIVSGSCDSTAKVWNVNTGTCIASLRHNLPVSSVAFSPDGLSIVTGSYKKVTVWKWGDSYVSAPDIVHSVSQDSWVSSVMFSSDGRKIIAGSSETVLTLGTDHQSTTTFKTFFNEDEHVFVHVDSMTALRPDGYGIVAVCRCLERGPEGRFCVYASYFYDYAAIRNKMHGGFNSTSLGQEIQSYLFRPPVMRQRDNTHHESMTRYRRRVNRAIKRWNQRLQGYGHRPVIEDDIGWEQNDAANIITNVIMKKRKRFLIN